MPQFNKKTKEEKTMRIFTTNWYLYKTHFPSATQKHQSLGSSLFTRTYNPRNTGHQNQKENEKNDNFEKLLIEAIDEGLSLLGESAKQAVYFHLEKIFNMNRKEIPQRIEEFTDAIEKIFGAGAKILEIQIMKSLYRKVGCTFKHHPKNNNITFTEYIAAIKAKQSLEKKHKHQKYTQTTKRDNFSALHSWKNPGIHNWLHRGFQGTHPI